MDRKIAGLLLCMSLMYLFGMFHVFYKHLYGPVNKCEKTTKMVCIMVAVPDNGVLESEVKSK